MEAREYLKLATDKTEAGDLIKENNLTEAIIKMLENYALIRVKNCSIPDVGKRFSCTCAEPAPNYPEMLWCDCCGKPIEEKVRIKLDEGSASVQRYVSGETKHALNEMVKRVRKIFES